MLKVDAGFYGRILIVIMVVTLVGLRISSPTPTGFAVKNVEKDFSEYAIIIEGNENMVCADGSFYQECSTLIKGKFCHLGKLVDYCELCGCEEGEVCEDSRCR